MGTKQNLFSPSFPLQQLLVRLTRQQGNFLVYLNYVPKTTRKIKKIRKNEKFLSKKKEKKKKRKKRKRDPPLIHRDSFDFYFRLFISILFFFSFLLFHFILFYFILFYFILFYFILFSFIFFVFFSWSPVSLFRFPFSILHSPFSVPFSILQKTQAKRAWDSNSC